jgi:hypothetical protein
MGFCLNRKVLIGLAVVAAAVFLVAPQAFGAALPVLILLACPLSMVFMMRGMAGQVAGADSPAETGATGATTPAEPPAEVVRLRAEVDQLRAEVRDREAGRLAEDA